MDWTCFRDWHAFKDSNKDLVAKVQQIRAEYLIPSAYVVILVIRGFPTLTDDVVCLQTTEPPVSRSETRC
jgi:hypothetical protein